MPAPRNGNPERDWGRPSWPSNPPKKSVRDDNDGCWLFSLALISTVLLTGYGIVQLVL